MAKPDKPYRHRTIGEHVLRPETLMMSYGYEPRPSEGSVKCPLFQTWTFVFERAEAGKAFFEVAYGLPWQLLLPRAELDQAGPGGGQGRLAPGRAAPPRVGFIVTNLSRPAERVVRFYNGRGTAEQWIKEGKLALSWTRLFCPPSATTRCACSSSRSPTTSQLPALARAAERGDALVAEHAMREAGQDRCSDRAPRRYVIFQLAEVAVPRALFAAILRRITWLGPRLLPT
jgi:hypothetical protein